MVLQTKYLEFLKRSGLLNEEGKMIKKQIAIIKSRPVLTVVGALIVLAVIVAIFSC